MSLEEETVESLRSRHPPSCPCLTASVSLPTGKHRGKAVGGHREKTDVYESGGEASLKTNPADIFISDIQPPELRENTCLWFQRPDLQGFATATRQPETAV